MGWDFGMWADVGGEERGYLDGYDRNYTFNVSPMFFRALAGTEIAEAGLRGLDGKLGSECAPLLTVMIERMEASPDAFKELNPPNGWGSYDGALHLLRELRRWCAEAPKARMRVS